MTASVAVKTGAVAAILLLAAGCGSSTGDRALGGGLIGATAGAAGTALFGGHILAGTAIGAGVGALTGAVTDKDTINLGEPPW
jgi:osmotically inducible lipoprotein OsmB